MNMRKAVLIGLIVSFLALGGISAAYAIGTNVNTTGVAYHLTGAPGKDIVVNGVRLTFDQTLNNASLTVSLLNASNVELAYFSASSGLNLAAGTPRWFSLVDENSSTANLPTPDQVYYVQVAIINNYGLASTCTSVTSSANPSVYGQSVTFKATVSSVAPSYTKPTGTVQFKIDGTNFGSPVSLINGSAISTAISNLTVGNHTVTAIYSGDSNFVTSIGTLCGGQTVKQAYKTTCTLVTSSQNPSMFGQSVMFTAKVTGTGGTPTGKVTLFDGTTNIGTGTLSSGTTAITSSLLSAGSHSITASYGGDTNYNGSLSNVVTQVVNVKNKATITLSSNNNPSVYGQSVTFKATVSPNTATGSVIFYDDNTALKTVSLSGNSASLSISTLTVGSHNITAVYSGDSNFAGSTSNVVVQKVRSKTVCTWPVKPSPCNFGQTCSFKVQIGWQGSGTPTGTVTFFDGPNNIGTGSWSGDTAFLSCFLSSGSHSITAKYSGDDNYDGSTSDTVTQTVNKGNSTITIKSSTNSARSGSTLTFTANLMAATAGLGSPTGSVTFKDGTTNKTLGTVVVNSSGQAIYFTSSLSVGTHSITAVYSGDNNFNGSTSNTVSPVITK